MLTDYWSIGLLSCSFATLFFSIVGAKTGYRVFRFWDLSAHTELQVRLEEEVCLTAALVEFGLVLQFISVVMLVLAADYFSTILVGAMCATGALTANFYGIPALAVKLIVLFFSVAWIVYHKLDLSSESFPLVKTKYVLIFCILPLSIIDCTLLTLYLYNLEPDIITSCCGVLFSSQGNDGFNLLGALSPYGFLSFYAVLVLAALGITLSLSRPGDNRTLSLYRGTTAISIWIVFYCCSLVVITVFVSPYVYAMPHHRCPFDLIKEPYLMIGYPLYFFLHMAVFAGISTTIGYLSSKKPGVARSSARLCKWGYWLSFGCIVIFLMIICYHPLMYYLRGGEV